MKQHFLQIFCLLFIAACGNQSQQTQNNQSLPAEKATVVQPTVTSLSEQQYKDLVFDFVESPTTWVYKGKRPCVVDFYADWCRPCKAIAPYFDSLAKVYAGKVDFYKVNVDNARNLSDFFNIQSIPFVMFCSDDIPQYVNGAYPIEFYTKMIDSLLLHKF